ncbi:amidohydrolase [Olivibacter sitiensis]|uniref:amidohydrolase n=1 Tax=Olivibacter sitiensis TaxID=376470 RepID=UPI0012FC4A46|nr:amidohydrolase [Olivibacter sitiensis]
MAQKKGTKNVQLKEHIMHSLDGKFDQLKQAEQAIWTYSEVGYKEKESSALLQGMLEEEGFQIEASVAGIPTAFVATYGTGKPVIGILAEYDALPGLSQDSLPIKKEVAGRLAGHGCGHNLFGVASVASGIELKKLIESKQIQGTVKVYGCPAEEGGSGKVYMVREGLFDGVDAVLHWHPSSQNSASASSSLANISAKFRFKGLASHAAGAPDKGRSALDGVEAMNNMVNMMREHIPSATRIHYIITDGGKAPNVVPDFAEVYYYVRHVDPKIVRSVFERVVNAAKGASLGTDTQVDYEIIGGVYNVLANVPLAKRMYDNLQQVGGVSYDASELAFAEQIQTSFTHEYPEINTAGTIQPFAITLNDATGGSTDVADVSWVVPTVGLAAATWVPGTPAHSWQAVAASGMNIGAKGMMVAAKTMAMMGIDLFADSDLREAARAELEKMRGPDFQYVPLLGERAPALNYRD